MTQRSYVNWNFASENVQTEITNGEYVSSESTLILGGPARLSHLAADGADALAQYTTMFPIGLLSNVSVSQNRQVNRLFEIGSKRAYFVPGRTFAAFDMGRVLFFGPSLMRMLYAVAPYRRIGGGQPFIVEGREVSTAAEYDKMFGTGSFSQLQSPPGAGGAPGSSSDNRDFFINLASELFSIPFGLCILLKDPKSKPYGAMYLEDCYIEAHTIGIDSGTIVVTEGVRGQVGQVAPVQLVTAVT
jgi:hypothetical protein